MPSFQGIWVPLVTPFQGAEIDFAALRRLVVHLLETGVSGLVVCGSTGEAAALSKAEQLAVLDSVLELAAPDQVVMGLAGNNLAELFSFQAEIQRRPIAGLLVPPPYYIRPSQQGLEAFFAMVADAARVPVILYDIPYRTGVSFERDTLLRIVQHPRILAIKDCGGNQDNTLALLASGNVDVLAGEDQQIFTALCLGAQGAISAAAHIHTELFVLLHRQVRESRWEAARETFFRLLPLIQALFIEPNPAPVKTALSIQGWMRDELRAPMQGSSPSTVARLQALLNVDLSAHQHQAHSVAGHGKSAQGL